MILQELLDRAELAAGGVANAPESQPDREVTAYVIYPHAVRAVYREQVKTGRHLDNLISEQPIEIVNGEGTVPDTMFREYLDRAYIPIDQFASYVPFEDYGRYRFNRQMKYFTMRGSKFFYSGDVPQILETPDATADESDFLILGDASAAQVGDRFYLYSESNGLIIDAYIASITGTASFTVCGRTIAPQPSSAISGVLYNGQDDVLVRSVTDVTATTESRIVSSAASNFTQDDVGRRFRLTSRDMPLNRTVTGTVDITEGVTGHEVNGLNLTPLDVGCRITVFDTATEQFVLDAVILTVSPLTEFTTHKPATGSSTLGTTKIYRQTDATNWLLNRRSDTGAFVQVDETNNTVTGASITSDDIGRLVLVHGTPAIDGSNPVLSGVITAGTGSSVTTANDPATGGCDYGSWWIFDLIAATEYYTTHDTVVDAIIDAVIDEGQAVLRAEPLWSQVDGNADILYSPLLVEAVGIPALPTDVCDALELAPEVAEDVIMKIASVLRGEMSMQKLIEVGSGK